MSTLPETTVGSDRNWPEAAWMGLRKHGCVLLRGVWPRSYIEACGRRSDEILDWFQGSGRSTLNSSDATYLKHKAFLIDHLTIDKVPAKQELEAPLFHLASLGLGRPTTVDTFSFVRRVDPSDTEEGAGHKLPFHQDQTILQQPLVNAWIPFADVGIDAPCLEVVAMHLKTLSPTITHTNHVYGEAGVEISAEHVIDTYPEHLVAPTLSMGDALVFYGTTIHRTYIAPGMSRHRTSVDMRFVAKVK